MYEREWSNPNYEFSSYPIDDLNWHIHFHEVFEICYTIEGKMKITIDKACYDLKEGDAVIIFPRQLHSYESPGHSKMQIITFMPYLAPEFTNNYKNKIPASNSLYNLKKYSDKFNSQNKIAQKGLLYSVLGNLIDSTIFKEASPSEDSQLLFKVLRFVENNYAGDCSLSTASEQLSYGYTYLSRMFKRLMNISYKEYLNKYRINRAVYMLSHEKNMPVQDIAIKCGYDSICSFNRNFKFFTGMTPTEMFKQTII